MVRSFPVPGGLFSPRKPSPEAFFRSVSRSVFQTPFLPAETAPRSRSGKPRPRSRPRSLSEKSAPKISRRSRSGKPFCHVLPLATPLSIFHSDGPRRGVCLPVPYRKPGPPASRPSFAAAFRRDFRPAVLQTPLPPSRRCRDRLQLRMFVFHLTEKPHSQPAICDNTKHPPFQPPARHAAAGIFRRHENNNQGDVSLSCRQKFAVPIFFCSAIHARSYPISTLLLPLFLRNPK